MQRIVYVYPAPQTLPAPRLSLIAQPQVYTPYPPVYYAPTFNMPQFIGPPNTVPIFTNNASAAVHTHPTSNVIPPNIIEQEEQTPRTKFAEKRHKHDSSGEKDIYMGIIASRYQTSVEERESIKQAINKNHKISKETIEPGDYIAIWSDEQKEYLAATVIYFSEDSSKMRVCYDSGDWLWETLEDLDYFTYSKTKPVEDLEFIEPITGTRYIISCEDGKVYKRELSRYTAVPFSSSSRNVTTKHDEVALKQKSSPSRIRTLFDQYESVLIQEDNLRATLDDLKKARRGLKMEIQEAIGEKRLSDYLKENPDTCSATFYATVENFFNKHGEPPSTSRSKPNF